MHYAHRFSQKMKEKRKKRIFYNQYHYKICIVSTSLYKIYIYIVEHIYTLYIVASGLCIINIVIYYSSHAHQYKIPGIY